MPATSSSLPTAHCLLPTRTGISLLEVLISMFVLLFGLMGVAAIFPVGNHYAGKADIYERSSVLGDQAFAELKARGLLNSYNWVYASPDAPNADTQNDNDKWHVIQQAVSVAPGDFNVLPTSIVGPGHVFVIDPMGAADATHYRFPSSAPVQSLQVWQRPISPNPSGNPPTAGRPKLFGTHWPIRRVTFAGAATPKTSTTVAETVCRLRDDLVNGEPEQDDRPGVQRFSINSQGTESPVDDVPLQRQYSGAYSWLATVSPGAYYPGDPGSAIALQPNNDQYLSAQQDVSVAVIHRRTLGDEFLLRAELEANDVLVVYGTADQLDKAFERFRDSQWIALCGVHPHRAQFMLQWYKVIYADRENDRNGADIFRRLTLVPTEWPTETRDDYPADPTNQLTAIYPVTDLQAIIIPGVVSVATEKMTMEGN